MGWKVPRSLCSCAGAYRFDHHYLGAFLFRLKDEGPGVQVGTHHIHRPNDDVLRIGETFQIESTGWTHRAKPRSGGARLTVALLLSVSTNAVKKGSGAGQPGQWALIPHVSVIGGCLWAVFVDNSCPLLLDFSERFVISDLLELSTAFRPCAFQGVQ